MTQAEVIFISEIMKDNINTLKQEATLMEASVERPITSEYIREKLVPKTEHALDILSQEFKKLNT